MSRNQRGDTIIEVLFAMTIIGVVLAAAYATASRNLQVSQLAKERAQATEIAIGQVDQLKALETAPADGQFCLDITQAAYVIPVPDPLCTIGFYNKIIEKTGNNIRVEVNWVPPGGDSNNPSIVEFYYSNFDFTFSGSSSVSATTVSSSGTGATLSVYVTSTTGVIRKGIVYGVNTSPQINDGVSLIMESTSISNPLTFTIDNLSPSTVYYVRGFYETSLGDITYGDIITINGIGNSGTLAGVTTSPATGIEISRATVSGDVVSEGSDPVTVRGIAYGTGPYPTITIAKTDEGAGSGPFTSTITGLAPDTTYYVRAYATNANGTAYGSQESFRTQSAPAEIEYETSYGGSSYFLSNELVTVEEARSIAASSGGHLVTITSAAENTLVSNMADGKYIWIGMNDLVTEGTWVWDTGEPVSYTNWNTGEPNDYRNGVPGEDAALMNWIGDYSGVWNDWFDSSGCVAHYGPGSECRAYYVIEYD